MGKTIKQVSAELNVSKPTVAKAIEQCGLSDALTRVGNRFELSDEQVETIKSQISPICDSPKTQTESEIIQNSQSDDVLETQKTQEKTEKSQTKSQTPQNSVIELLEGQLEALQQQLTVKDEQLAAKDKQLADLTAALLSAQEQHKALTDALTAAQALHAGTIQERLTVAEQPNADEVSVSVSEAPSEQPPKKRGFFARLFGKD